MVPILPEVVWVLGSVPLRLKVVVLLGAPATVVSTAVARERVDAVKLPVAAVKPSDAA